MIDPTNTEPISIHKPHPWRVVGVLALLVLFTVAVTLVLREVDFGSPTSEIPVVPPPITGNGTSRYTDKMRAEISAVQNRMNMGEITEIEGMRLIETIIAGG